MKSVHLYQIVFTGFTLLFILACNALVPPSAATPSPVPTAIPSIPERKGFVLSTLAFNETSESPAFTMNIEFPAMLDNSDPRTAGFNHHIDTLIQTEISGFKQIVSEMPVDPNFAASSFEGKYSLLFQSDAIASIKFDFSGYTSGAAHPYHYSKTVNYRVDQGRSLSLNELFLPGSSYLEAISSYCVAELSKRDIGFEMFSEGAAPRPENYRNWNITPDGLMVTFDEYQVAPYAAGAQTVVVPYRELQAAIHPESPLSPFTQ